MGSVAKGWKVCARLCDHCFLQSCPYLGPLAAMSVIVCCICQCFQILCVLSAARFKPWLASVILVGQTASVLEPGCYAQVVRARLQQRQAQNRAVQYRDGLATFRLILQREGAGGLYKGLLPNVLRVMPQSAITFLVYEKVMQLLEAEVFRNLERSWGH